MKKLLGIVVLGLLWCANANAEIVEFNKCFKDKYESFEDSNTKNNILFKVEDRIITINFSNNTLTWTIRRSKATVLEMNKELKKIDPEMEKFTKNTQRIFDLTTYAEGVITAKDVDQNEAIRTDFTIYLDFEKKAYDWESVTTNTETNKVLFSDEENYICENISTETKEKVTSNKDTV